MAQSQIQAAVERAIDDLPDEFRTVLVARVLEEMSVEETAELLGLKIETVKTRLHRAPASSAAGGREADRPGPARRISVRRATLRADDG